MEPFAAIIPGLKENESQHFIGSNIVDFIDKNCAVLLETWYFAEGHSKNSTIPEFLITLTILKQRKGLAL